MTCSNKLFMDSLANISNMLAVAAVMQHVAGNIYSQTATDSRALLLLLLLWLQLA